ncbi:YlbG family protein [Staphylococcus cohnii]|uniref:YlbG family protein n=1 Tax=Staphylococcus cohnii TaxID=29382 RepID=UPI0036B0BB9A
MNIVSRTSLVIYLKHMKHERQIRKFGHIVSTNKLHRYVIMYINEEEVDAIVDKLMNLKYVKHIAGSPYKYLKKEYPKNNMNFLDYMILK